MFMGAASVRLSTQTSPTAKQKWLVAFNPRAILSTSRVAFPMKTPPALLISILLATACARRDGMDDGSGVLANEDRQLSSFQYVQLHGAGQVTIRRGEHPRATLTWDDNLLARVSTRVEGPMLVIAPDSNARSAQSLRVELEGPDVSGVAVLGSGALRVESIRATNFLIRVTGSGRITVQGHAESLEIKIDGDGQVDASGLSAGDARVILLGDGAARVHATNQLAVTLTGNGHVRYRGPPKKLLKTIRGKGQVAPM